MRTTERPLASCPVTTLRYRLGLKDRARGSLWLDPDFLHDPAPFLAVGANRFGKGSRRFGAFGEESEVVQPLYGFRILEDLVHLAIHPLHGLPRRSGSGPETQPHDQLQPRPI